MNKENVCKTFCVVASSPSPSLSIFLPTPPLSYFQVREESEQRESAISPSEMENQTGFRKSGEIAYKALNNEFRMRKPVTTGRDCVLLFASVTPLDVFKQTGCFLRDAGTFLAVFLAKLLIFLTRTLFLVTKTGYFFTRHWCVSRRICGVRNQKYFTRIWEYIQPWMWRQNCVF